jgi:hypothetical protein
VEKASSRLWGITNATFAPKRTEATWVMTNMKDMIHVDADTATELFYKNNWTDCLLKYVDCDAAN